MDAGKFIYFKSFTLPADGSPFYTPMAGEFFLCSKANFAFEMSLDGGSFFPMAQGLNFNISPGYKGLWFKATSGSDTAIEFYSSNFRVADSRLSIIKDVSQSSLYIKNAPTTTLAGSAAIAPGSTVTISGGNGGGLRKAVIITNMDAALGVDIQDSDGTTGGLIYATEKVTLETSDTIKIKNNNGVAVNIAWIEIYFP
jgi:hypothetical protein